MLVYPTSTLAVFLCCIFLPLNVADCHDFAVSLFLSYGCKRMLGIYILVSWVILFQLLMTPFHLVNLHTMRFIAFFLEIIFLLPPFFFVNALKWSRHYIHYQVWVQYSTPWLFFCVEGDAFICWYQFYSHGNCLLVYYWLDISDVSSIIWCKIDILDR